MNYPIKTLVVDDELIARKGIIKMLSFYSNIEIVGEACDVKTCLQLIQHTNPSVLFLDIRLHQQNSLDYIRHISPMPHIVFTTAYPQYAVQSYEYEAVDYLLKPISAAHLDRAVGRIMAKNISAAAAKNTIFVKADGKYQRIELADILFVKGMENYVNIYTTKGKTTIKSTMQCLADQLPAQQFIRIHKSYIVNKSKVELLDKNALYIQEHTLPISRENKELIYSKIIG